MKKISILISCLSVSAMLHAAPIEQRNLSSTPSTAIVPSQQSTQFWELNQQIQQLQNQIRQLRGQIEEQDNQIEQMNKELQNRYTDLDQRLELLGQKIETQDETEENPDVTEPDHSTAPDSATVKPQQNSHIDSSLDEAAYQMAYDAYKQGGAAKAIQPMENFIKNHPNSAYVSHAYYWLGEFNLALTPPNFNQAKENFEIVAGNYPKSSKTPAALYRLSEIAKNIDQDIPRAREYYLKLIQNYANSREAETARTSLNL